MPRRTSTAPRVQSWSWSLPFHLTSVPKARRLVSQTLGSRRQSDPMYSTTRCSVLSELVGNALRHARPRSDGDIEVKLVLDEESIVISVADGGAATVPSVVSPAPLARSGRGLGIVHTLTRDWGVKETRTATPCSAYWAAPEGASTSRDSDVTQPPLMQACPPCRKRTPWARSPAPSRAVDTAATGSARVSPARAAPAAATRPATAAATAPRRMSSRRFAGLPGECDWVALREFVPAGIAPLTLQADAFDGAADGDDASRWSSVLPGIAPALKRRRRRRLGRGAGRSPVGRPEPRLRRGAEPGAGRSSRARACDDRAARRWAAAAGRRRPDCGVRGRRCSTASTSGSRASTTRTARSRRRSRSSTRRSTRPRGCRSVDAAYWTSVGTKEHLRWVMPHDEETLLTALARLHAAGARPAHSRVASGRVVPRPRPAGAGVGPAGRAPAPRRSRSRPARFCRRLEDALADSTALSDERAARHGLATRQVTIR